MKNRITVRHGMLGDLKAYLKQSGWKLEPPVGAYEVLRARRQGYPRPLLVHDELRRMRVQHRRERHESVPGLEEKPPAPWP